MTTDSETSTATEETIADIQGGDETVNFSATRVPVAHLALELGGYRNIRRKTGLDQKSIEELAADLDERGQKVEALVLACRLSDGGPVSFLVLDGQRRVLAFKYLQKVKKKTQMVEVKWDEPRVVLLTEKVIKEKQLDAFAILAKREGLSSYELTLGAQELRDRGATMEEIGEAIGKSHSWVSRMIGAVAKAEKPVVDAWAKGKLTDEAFKDIAAIAADAQPEALETAVAAKDADRETKGKVRQAAKEKSGKGKAKKGKSKGPDRVPSSLLAELVEYGKSHKTSDPYIKGVLDGAAYSLGEKDVEDFGSKFTAWMKQGSEVKGKK